MVKQGQSGQSQAGQLAGHDENGMTAQASIVLEEDSSSGKLKGLVVKNIVPTGPMATAFGLQVGDEIVEVWGQKVRDALDVELAKDQVYESYNRNMPLVILRNGQELTLTPDSPLTTAHPNLFGKPGATAQPVPTH